MKPGDKFTIAHVHPWMRNPARKWWQFWKPKWVVDTSRLAEFTVR